MIMNGQKRQTVASGVTRRRFLAAGGVGLSALGLGLHELEALAGLETKPDRSVILLLLVGGPSQLETWDPKPDAPAEVRGPFGSIATRCPGVRISEYLPRMAARMDQIALVRSLYHESSPIHETGFQLLQTGRLGQAGEHNPHAGSAVARLLGTGNERPPFVVIPRPLASTGVDIPRGQSAGWLGSAYEPVYLSADPTELRSNLTLPGDATSRHDYGDTAFGRSCQLARRLVGTGVRLVTVNMFETVFNRVSWDCHGAAPFSTLDDYALDLLPTFDQAFTALIDDLEQAGRLETTLVVAAGEFGRTPRLNASGGRDHWPAVWSVALAGGGVCGGQVVGASDGCASAPADRPVTPQDLLATIYHSLGIDRSHLLGRNDDASYPLVEDGAVIHELFG
jgi:hypothetical protein